MWLRTMITCLAIYLVYLGFSKLKYCPSKYAVLLCGEDSVGLTCLQLGKYRGYPLYGSSVLTFSEEAESDQRDSLVSVVRLQSTWEEPSYNCLQNLRTGRAFGMDVSPVWMYVVFLNPLLSSVLFYYNSQHLAKSFSKFQVDFFGLLLLSLL